MGYRTNPLARALPTGRTSLLAVIVADVTNPFFFEILRGAEETATKAGYTLLVADVQESVEAERQALDRTLPMVEGLVLATSRMSDSSIRVAAKQLPTVVLNRSMSDIASVATDNSRGMKRAVEHLAGLGHTTITYLAGPDASWANGVRWQAMREADARTRHPRPPPRAVLADAGGRSRRRARARRRAEHGGHRLQRPHRDRHDARAGQPRHPRSRTTCRWWGSTTSSAPTSAPLSSPPSRRRCDSSEPWRCASSSRSCARPARGARQAPQGPLKTALLPANLVERMSTGPASPAVARRETD